MSTENLTSFNTLDYVEMVKKKRLAQKRDIGSFPVIDRKGDVYGLISRRRLLEASKKRVILVDHNEKSQAVDGIEEAENFGDY